ncbi:GNAT family N-acetyltransferase [Bacillus sp. FJAT-28004]|uniref:GNAT family N-acetyltransferase n=1 Tax=Bacillus sp. FJAT-28004 TaxID=1679165 RepID=UPI0006B539B3|nr:GNAT family N-acetyltransferase [Bacillus sp. FJAT-28004]
MRIRQATIDDVPGISHVHVASWKTTYKGIISDEYLSKLSVESRINNWNWVFNRSNPDEVIYVMESDDGAIVGFANGGKCRSEQYHYDSELYSIYLLEEYQGLGYGKALFSAVVNHLKRHHYQSLMVWVLEKNCATAFYYRLGAEAFTKKDIQIGNDTVTELGLGWNELL